ncbi:hypothetical protein EJ110_NYTH26728 [Nymphaea thermarum]|nr:hypothetical protein EJ110_NYTH26728 [Nymphaea thermarum]
MQRLMQTKFVPSDHAERAYKEYLNLRQGSRSVADYTAEFHRLSLRVQIVEAERQQVASYFSGLRPFISDEFNCTRVDTLDQASSYAMNIEEILKGKHETRVSRGDASYHPKSSFPTRGGSSSKPVESKPVPPSPGKGEQSGPAYNTRSKTCSSDQTIRCFRCHELGHLASKCPNSHKKTHLAETIEEPPDSDGKEVSSGSSDSSSDQDDAVHFDGDDISNLLPIRHVLTAPKGKSDSSWLRGYAVSLGMRVYVTSGRVQDAASSKKNWVRMVREMEKMLRQRVAQPANSCSSSSGVSFLDQIISPLYEVIAAVNSFLTLSLDYTGGSKQ